MRAVSIIAALAVISVSSAKDTKQTRKLRGGSEPAEPSDFMKEVVDEDVKFWTRELGRNLGSCRK